MAQEFYNLKFHQQVAYSNKQVFLIFINIPMCPNLSIIEAYLLINLCLSLKQKKTLLPFFKHSIHLPQVCRFTKRR